MLFHATYKTHMQSIKDRGLLIKQPSANWDDVEPGNYFANDPDIAYSFAESAEKYNDEEIVILAIDESEVMKELSGKFTYDPQIYDDGDVYSVRFTENIPSAYLYEYVNGLCRSLSTKKTRTWTHAIDCMPLLYHYGEI